MQDFPGDVVYAPHDFACEQNLKTLSLAQINKISTAQKQDND
jgi:hypothetical protein